MTPCIPPAHANTCTDTHSVEGRRLAARGTLAQMRTPTRPTPGRRVGCGAGAGGCGRRFKRPIAQFQSPGSGAHCQRSYSGRPVRGVASARKHPRQQALRPSEGGVAPQRTGRPALAADAGIHHVFVCFGTGNTYRIPEAMAGLRRVLTARGHRHGDRGKTTDQCSSTRTARRLGRADRLPDPIRRRTEESN